METCKKEKIINPLALNWSTMRTLKNETITLSKDQQQVGTDNFERRKEVLLSLAINHPLRMKIIDGALQKKSFSIAEVCTEQRIEFSVGMQHFAILKRARVIKDHNPFLFSILKKIRKIRLIKQPLIKQPVKRFKIDQIGLIKAMEFRTKEYVKNDNVEHYSCVKTA